MTEYDMTDLSDAPEKIKKEIIRNAELLEAANLENPAQKTPEVKT